MVKKFMMSSPLADFLIRIKNSYLSGQKKTAVPYSLLKEELTKLLVNKGYLADFEVKKEKERRKEITLYLKYDEGRKPAFSEVKIASRPGLRVYAGRNKIPRFLGGLGTTIVSTSKGLMTGSEARKAGLGGEIICGIW